MSIPNKGYGELYAQEGDENENTHKGEREDCITQENMIPFTISHHELYIHFEYTIIFNMVRLESIIRLTHKYDYLIRISNIP
mgnify:CR=1 FL=1